MYKLLKNIFGVVDTVQNLETTSCIPLHSDNTDYQQFKLDLANGVELQDAQGNVMTADQIKAFEATLP